MTEISDFEKEKIAELRERVGVHLLAKHPSFNTDFDMLRWLQGYDFDIDTIVPQLRRHLLLRKAWKLDTIVDDYKHPSIVTEKFYYFGMFQTPVEVAEYAGISIDSVGRVDCDGLVRSIAFIPILKRNVWGCEIDMRNIREREKLTGKQSRIVDIMDLDGMHVDSAFLSFVAGTYKSFCSFIVANYVEMIKTFVLVNAPAPIYYVWNYLLAPLVPAKTREKVIILGANWKEEILQHVDASALPVEYGGTRVDVKVVVPERVLTEFYWNRSDDPRYTEDVVTVSIPAGKCASVYVRANAGNVLEWIAFCESAYTFSIEFVEKNAEENGNITVCARTESACDEIFPPIEIAGNRWLPEDNAFDCDETGTYVVSFRNLHWFGRIQLRCAILVSGRKLRCFRKQK